MWQRRRPPCENSGELGLGGASASGGGTPPEGRMSLTSGAHPVDAQGHFMTVGGGIHQHSKTVLDAFHLTKNIISFQNIGKIYEKSRKIKNKNLRGKNKNVGPRQKARPTKLDVSC